MVYISAKFRNFSRRNRLLFIILSFTIFFLFMKSVRHSQHRNHQIHTKKLVPIQEEKFKSKELRLIRLGYIKWQKCMLELIDEQQLTLEDLDPLDPRFIELQAVVLENQEKLRKHDILDDYDDERFEKMWAGLNGYSKKCWQETDIWHMEPSRLPGTKIAYFLPYNHNTPVTVVKISNNTNAQFHKLLKTRLNKEAEFYEINSNINTAKRYKNVAKYYFMKIGKNNVPIEDVFTKTIEKTLIDYLFIEDIDNEYEIMEALRKDGLLETLGITVCQINVTYSRPLSPDDPRKEQFRKHIVRFIREGNYTLLMASNYASQKVFWVNTHSIECQQRYLEKSFSNDVDFV